MKVKEQKREITSQSSLAERACQAMDEQRLPSSAWRADRCSDRFSVWLRIRLWHCFPCLGAGGPDPHLSFWVRIQFSMVLTPKCGRVCKNHVIEFIDSSNKSLTALHMNHLIKTGEKAYFEAHFFWCHLKKVDLFLMQKVHSKNMLLPKKICN